MPFLQGTYALSPNGSHSPTYSPIKRYLFTLPLPALLDSGTGLIRFFSTNSLMYLMVFCRESIIKWAYCWFVTR